MEIKILGAGCSKCNTLEQVTRKVLKDNNIDASITKVDDIVEIMKFNVMVTPALVVNEKVVSKGRIPTADEIKQFLTK